ncbi:MAG: error-prone DNA polymerase [Pirellulales bacterium]
MDYAELHAKSNFSFLEGAAHPDELAEQAAVLGYQALAITDRASLAGVVRAHGAAKPLGLKLLIGAELHPVDAPPVVVWATDRAAYGRLARLITVGRRRAAKGECHLLFADIAEHAEGLLAGVMLAGSVGCVKRSADAPSSAIIQNTLDDTSDLADGASALRLTHPASGCLGSSGASPQQTTVMGTSSGGELSLDPRRPALRLTHPTLPLRAPPGFGGSVGLSPHPTAAYRELFGDRCYALAELHRGPDDARQLACMVALAREARLPLVAAGDVHYHLPQRKILHDVLVATRHGCTVAEAGERLFTNAERHLRPLDEIAALFAAAPGAMERTCEVADRCTFSLDELKYEYPEELAPPGLTPFEYLQRLTWAGAAQRYPHGVPEKVRGLLTHELGLIGELGYEAYFLTVWDLVRFARSREILCQGRGSAANSAVCYCLGVTAVDPERMDVLFERFISRERNEAPDIDVDFEHERREEVLQYIYEKYGRERAGMTAEVICYRPRSAVRDVGKALGLSLDRVDALAKSLEGHRAHADRLVDRLEQAGLDPESAIGRQLEYVLHEISGFPRHLSQHTGGMVMTRGPLCELVPIENAAMEGRTVIQWNKDDLDELGILKVDCLALGMLTAIRKCFDLVAGQTGRRLGLADVPEGDQQVYDMICRADTMGVFQIESRAQMSMLPRLRPRCFHDLVVEVAIVRPGPIQGNMVHPYLKRRAGLEQVNYPSPEIRAVLEKTLGVPLFQEQAMRLAVVAAGFTPGEADQLRRAMAAWRRPGIIDQFREKLLRGMQERGLSAEFAQQVFQQISGFGEYGFPESHAASFALLVYVSCWLKHYYPAAFTAALINSQPMGFYAPAQLVRNAQEHGVSVRPIDVNHSGWDCTLEVGWGEALRAPPGSGDSVGLSQGLSEADVGCVQRSADAPAVGLATAGASALRLTHPTLRLGLRLVQGLSEVQAQAVEKARARGPFRSLEDFARRTRLPRAALEQLAAADAFGSLELSRRSALWQALGQDPKPDARPLLAEIEPEQDRAAALPVMSEAAEVAADYQAAGLTLRSHPVSFFRQELDSLGVARAAQLATLPKNRPVQVAGLVLVRQRPGTAKGITFVTLEDETGVANLIIRPEVWQRYYRAARTAAALLAEGPLQREGQVIHVLVRRLEDLSDRLRGMRSQSRDFH